MTTRLGGGCEEIGTFLRCKAVGGMVPPNTAYVLITRRAPRRRRTAADPKINEEDLQMEEIFRGGAKLGRLRQHERLLKQMRSSMSEVL
jgi:hypothetical protein